jgi:LmbE family N-acetylglucosaminyl deacetylase
MFFYRPMKKERKHIAVITAHPDDETLWTGGWILDNPDNDYFVASLCRCDDTDRAPKFKKALQALGAEGAMGDMDDGPEQFPLPGEEVEWRITQLLPTHTFDLVITHSIFGEYTRHRRHEEIGRGAIGLWQSGRVKTKELWAFAFEDGGRTYYPQPLDDASLTYNLPEPTWKKKYEIVTNVYGFAADSWEAQATPRAEAFRQFYNAPAAYNWLLSAQIPT